MKRLLTLVLTICICASACALPVASADEVQQANGDAAMLADLGIVSIAEADSMTRAAFVGYVSEALLPETVLPSEKLPFTDLPLDSAEYNDIYNAYLLGILKGNDGLLHPYEEISEMEAITMLLRVLGYEPVAIAKGGYPSGYLTCARTTELLRDASDLSAKLTSQRAATLIRRTLEIETLEPTGYAEGKVQYTYDGRTILYAKYGIIREEGVLQAFGESALIQEYETTKNHAVIGGNKYKCDINLLSYLGYRLEYYYREATEEIAAAYPYKNEINVIEATEEPTLSGRKLSYTRNDKTASVTLSGTVSVIYNGKCKSNYTADDFAVKKGRITVIDNGEGGNTVAVIDAYDSYVVQRVNTKELLIIDKTERDKQIDISDDCHIAILAEDGTEVQTKDLRENDILTLCISENGKVIYGYLSRKSVQGEISAKTVEGDDTYVTISDVTYKIESNLLQKKALGVRSVGHFYLDCYGDIVWYDTKAMAEDLAVLVKVGLDDSAFGSSRVLIQMFCGDGSMRTVKTAEKFTLDGVKCGTFSTVPEALAPGNLIRFVLNSKDELTWIDSEATTYAEGSDSLTLLRPEEESFYLVGSLQGMFIPQDTTTVFMLPDLSRSDYADVEFKVGGKEVITSNETYMTKGYALSKKVGNADVLVLRTPATGNAIRWNSGSSLLKEIRQVYVPEKDDVCWTVTLAQYEGERVYYIDEELLTQNGYGTGQDYSVTTGDIVAVRFRQADQTIVAMEVIFDCEKQEMNPNSKLFSVSGYTGFYQERQLQYGQAYSLEGNILGMTMASAPSAKTFVPGKPASEATQADIYYIQCQENVIWIVDTSYASGSAKRVRRGTYADIKDYQHYTDCSNVLMQSGYGTLYRVVVFQ